ncbi:hypothetical protein LINGRAPRIM_LOCUS2286, partial [Linum grandiflorum]
EQDFRVEIPTFDGSFQPEEFIDWLSQVEEFLDFKEVPKGRRVSLVTIRFAWSRTSMVTTIETDTCSSW